MRISTILREFWWSLAIPGTEPARVLARQQEERAQARHALWEEHRIEKERRAELEEHGITVKPVTGNPGYVISVLDPENPDSVLFDWTTDRYLTREQAWNAAWAEFSLRKEAFTDGTHE